jgi:hypothetical protein
VVLTARSFQIGKVVLGHIAEQVIALCAGRVRKKRHKASLIDIEFLKARVLPR